MLNLGPEARMNVPGRASGNWDWRFRAEALTPEILERLADLTELYGRAANRESRRRSQGTAREASLGMASH